MSYSESCGKPNSCDVAIQVPVSHLYGVKISISITRSSQLSHRQSATDVDGSLRVGQVVTHVVGIKSETLVNLNIQDIPSCCRVSSYISFGC